MQPNMNNHISIKVAMPLLLVVLLAACGLEPPFDPPPLPARDAGQISSDELPATVAEGMAGLDLDFPDDEEGLHLYPRGNLLVLIGTVDSDSLKQVYDALKDSPEIQVVVLALVPGSADDEANLKLGKMLRQAGMTTYLPAQGVAASGGVDLLLSGAQRILERGARVGVHSWSDGDGVNGNEIPRENTLHQPYLEYYREMGIPEDFYWFTLEAAPPEGEHWMTEAEMERFNIFTELR